MNREIFVYIDLNEQAILVGKLWARDRKGRQSASFEYSASWLRHQEKFSLEPALTIGPGLFHTPQDRSLFGALGDSAPDTWGRTLMRRAERIRSKSENTVPRNLMEIDYLLLVNDESRQGALRYAEVAGGPFLANNPKAKIPPLIDLAKLLSATEKIGTDSESDAELHLLLAPGSSLGGARPKASIRDRDSSLAIAKFPHQNDEIRVVQWEALALNLAEKSGVEVPKRRIVQAGGKDILLLQRFDRVGRRRIPFLSAMSMLGAKDSERRSYLEIVDAIRQYGSTPRSDMAQLWRRLVFNVLISNTDDHLRNHGFLYKGGAGWSLSPAYDLNPVPADIGRRILSTEIQNGDATASLKSAMDVASYFELDEEEARKISREVGITVATWRKEAAAMGLRDAEMNRMETAFEHEDLKSALT